MFGCIIPIILYTPTHNPYWEWNCAVLFWYCQRKLAGSHVEWWLGILQRCLFD